MPHTVSDIDTYKTKLADHAPHCQWHWHIQDQAGGPCSTLSVTLTPTRPSWRTMPHTVSDIDTYKTKLADHAPHCQWHWHLQDQAGGPCPTLSVTLTPTRPSWRTMLHTVSDIDTYKTKLTDHAPHCQWHWHRQDQAAGPCPTLSVTLTPTRPSWRTMPHTVSDIDTYKTKLADHAPHCQWHWHLQDQAGGPCPTLSVTLTPTRPSWRTMLHTVSDIDTDKTKLTDHAPHCQWHWHRQDQAAGPCPTLSVTLTPTRPSWRTMLHTVSDIDIYKTKLADHAPHCQWHWHLQDQANGPCPTLSVTLTLTRPSWRTMPHTVSDIDTDKTKLADHAPHCQWHWHRQDQAGGPCSTLSVTLTPTRPSCRTMPHTVSDIDTDKTKLADHAPHCQWHWHLQDQAGAPCPTLSVTLTSTRPSWRTMPHTVSDIDTYKTKLADHAPHCQWHWHLKDQAGGPCPTLSVTLTPTRPSWRTMLHTVSDIDTYKTKLTDHAPHCQWHWHRQDQAGGPCSTLSVTLTPTRPLRQYYKTTNNDE